MLFQKICQCFPHQHSSPVIVLHGPTPFGLAFTSSPAVLPLTTALQACWLQVLSELSSYVTPFIPELFSPASILQV